MLFEKIFIASIAIACVLLILVAWQYVAPIAYDPLGPRPYPILLLSLTGELYLFTLSTSKIIRPRRYWIFKTAGAKESWFKSFVLFYLCF